MAPLSTRLWPVDVPVVPDGDQAREWLERELSKPEYAAAQPTWFDLLIQQILEWLGQFTVDTSGTTGFPWWAIILVAIVAIIAIAVFRTVGLPRLQRRRAAAGALFGDDDERDAATIRKAARQAASRSDWSLAVTELFRAIARDLDERTLVAVLPGTTAHGFARGAAAVFPAESDALDASAGDFDLVRYLGEPGTREQYERLAALDERLRVARPVLTAVPA